MVCKAKIMTTIPDTKVEVTTGKCHDKNGDPMFAVIRRSRDERTPNWGPPEMQTIENGTGVGQIVNNAHRRRLADQDSGKQKKTTGSPEEVQ